MKKFWVYLSVSMSSLGLAYADIVCHFYSYNCVTEMNMLDVRLHKIRNPSVCQQVHSDEKFRQTLAEQNYMTPSTPRYTEVINGKRWLLNSNEPYIKFSPQLCKIAGKNIEVLIEPYPQNENANGRCGASDNDIKLTLKNNEDLIFREYFIDDCHSAQELEAVRYSVESSKSHKSSSIETWRINGAGECFYKHEIIDTE